MKRQTVIIGRRNVILPARNQYRGSQRIESEIKRKGKPPAYFINMLTRALLLCPIGLFIESPFDQPMKPEERTVIEYGYIFFTVG